MSANFSERLNRFTAGYADGQSDKARSTGRPIADEDRDYAFGYVAGKYEQLAGWKTPTLESAKLVWEDYRKYTGEHSS